MKRDEPGVKIFFRSDVKTSIDNKGCLVVTKINRLNLDKRALIVIPQKLSDGLLYSLHLNLNHPLASQLFQAVDSRFFISDLANKCKTVTDFCAPCMSLKDIPTEVSSFKSNLVPNHPGIAFTADVIKTNKKLIMAAVDNFSGFVSATFIKAENMEELRDGIVATVTPFIASGIGRARVRVDPAPGFQKLSNMVSHLAELGIDLELGNTKNKNKVALVDTKIKEIRKALVKAATPSNNVINIRTLAKAVTAVNETVRANHLSAKEIHFARDRVSNKNLNLKDEDLAEATQQRRESDNKSRSKAEATRLPMAHPADAKPGNVVFVKQEGSKTAARDLYLVIDSNSMDQVVTICKLRDVMAGKLASMEPQRYSYKVKQTDIYLAPNQPDITLHHNVDQVKEHDEQEVVSYPRYTTPPPPQAPRPPRAQQRKHPVLPYESDSEWEEEEEERERNNERPMVEAAEGEDDSEEGGGG